MAIDTYTIEQFCERHNISKAFFYKLRKSGMAPKIAKLGRRSIITREAAEEWRRTLNENAA